MNGDIDLGNCYKQRFRGWRDLVITVPVEFHFNGD
jgi:hypothetical protein